MADIVRRMHEVSKEILRVVGDQDAWGLDLATFNERGDTQIIVNAGQYAFLTSDKKLDTFNKWLQNLIDHKVINPNEVNLPWTGKYSESAYRQGVVRAYLDANKREWRQPFFLDNKAAFVRKALSDPKTLSKIRLLATRSFENIKGITAAQKAALNRILADSIVKGTSAKKVAKQMVEQIDGMTKTKALTIARTEIVHAHAEGQLDTYEQLGVSEVGVLAEWVTAGDSKVCSQCASMEGKTFPIDQARGLIPLHPNCRCAWSPIEPPKKEKPKAQKIR